MPPEQGAPLPARPTGAPSHQLFIELGGETEAFDVGGRAWPGPPGRDIIVSEPRHRDSPPPWDGPAPLDVVTAPSPRGLIDRLNAPVQVAFTLSVLLSLPFIVYVLVFFAGFDLTKVTYPLIAAALAVTVVALLVEGISATRRVAPPGAPPGAYPPATAVIAADLSSGSAGIVQTVSNMLGQEYPGEFEVILAYSSSQRLPVEERLADMAARDARLVTLKVGAGSSMSDHLLVALERARGEMIGVFDADDRPEQGSFARAWRWLSRGQDVVQGHRVVRNGSTSWVARLVAVDFERIYAVGQGSQARWHGPGWSAGPNTYWRRDVLAPAQAGQEGTGTAVPSTMHGVRPDQSASTDRGLLSSVLAPTTMGALWRQRVQWARGRAAPAQTRSRPVLGLPGARTRLRAKVISGCAQVAPWVTVQVFPLLAFVAWRERGLGRMGSVVPLLSLLGALVLSVGVVQPVLAYRLGDDRIRHHRSWFVLYSVHSILWFGELKRVATWVAQLGLGKPAEHH
ncbi:MAG: glycosyltransferase family 2 protein [Acidimicrobiales bacterium]